jgi:NAD(P)-dependent dehydrogenase (short-subunit alcohol dehydrogenase family)
MNSRTAVVTGAARGIGRAVCERLHESGYRVFGVDREPVPDREYPVFQIDLVDLARDPESHVLALLEREIGPKLQVLVHNASLQVVKPVEQVTRKDWQVTLEVNLLAPFHLTMRFLEQLRCARGSVIHMGSIHSRLTKKDFAVYATSKAALDGLTRSLALDLAPEVRVNAIHPAATATEMLSEGFGKDANGLKNLGSFHPLGRIADPDEVAQAVLFLADGQSSFMTGESIHVNGGIGCRLHDPG